VQGHPGPTVACVLCGALAREIIDIAKAHDWNVKLFGVAASDHLHPERIAPDVERRLRELIPEFDRIIVIYGDCGTGGRLDDVLTRYNVPRIAGPHCYEMYGGPAFEALIAEEPGSFFLTDFLVRSWHGTVHKGLGLDRFPELLPVYFGNYTRLVYLIQRVDQQLLDRARSIAASLNVPLEIRLSGYGLLEERLVALMAEIHEDRWKPVLPPHEEQLHGDLPDPLLARPSSSGARSRRWRSRERSAP
jgi:hypothetical protein